MTERPELDPEQSSENIGSEIPAFPPRFRRRTPAEDDVLRGGIQSYLRRNPHIAKKSSVDAEITDVIGRVVQQASETAVATATLPGEGTYHKTPTGLWVGPNGKFTPESPIGQQLEEELAKQSTD